MSAIFRITLSLNSQDRLREVGPVIPASWAATPNNWQTQVRGNVLLDTGASHLCIDAAVARELGIAEAGKEDVDGLGGKRSLSTCDATLLLEVVPLVAMPNVKQGSQVSIGFPLRVQVVEGLKRSYQDRGIVTPNGLPVIGILGRTILQFTTFTYEGLSGRIVIDIDETIRHPR